MPEIDYGRMATPIAGERIDVGDAVFVGEDCKVYLVDREKAEARKLADAMLAERSKHP